ncbi:hypothetical protein PXNS11_230005 [Stutzerimonas xanthomarina]|nr:hypothetical protein PXNS11_230005 [Stutzerimonas xanthomarina]
MVWAHTREHVLYERPLTFPFRGYTVSEPTKWIPNAKLWIPCLGTT